MLIVCPHCQARYEFPAEQLDGEVLRVRCSACGQVATVKSDGSTTDAAPASRGVNDDAPALSGYSVIQRRSRAPQPVAPPETLSTPPAPAPPVVDPSMLSAVPEPPGVPPPVVAPPRAPFDVSDSLPPDPLEDFGQEEPPSDPPTPAAPPASGPPAAQAPARPAAQKPAGKARRVNAPEPSITITEAPRPSQVSEGGRDDREVAVQPSIIIDMGSIAPVKPTPTPLPGAPSPVPLRAAPAPAVVNFDPSVEVLSIDDIPEVPRRSAGHFFGSLLVFTLAGLVFFVWARNDFQDIFRAPDKAVARAFGAAPSSTPATTPPPTVEAPRPEGELTVADVQIQALAKRGTGLLVRGRLHNGSNVTHRAIALRAQLLREGMPVRERTVACCDDLDAAAAQLVAQTPNHPHLSPKLNHLSDVALPPGSDRPFSVVFPDTGDLAPAMVAPLVEIKHSEVGRAP